MEHENYPPGFSPEEIAKRASRNPTDIVNENLVSVSKKYKEYEQELDEKLMHLQELCKNWKPEHYQDYLHTIYAVCDIFRQIHDLSEFGNTLYEWHCF